MTSKETKETQINEEINIFLSESNAIEGVYDNDSLKQARTAWNYLISQTKLTSENIQNTHQLLMANQDLPTEYKGKWRTCRVWVGRTEAQPYDKIPQLIQEWLDEIDSLSNTNLNDEEKALPFQNLHVQYEHIHPFVDGNGRTGRMFWNFLRLKNGLPLITVYKKDRFDYYRLFQ